MKIRNTSNIAFKYFIYIKYEQVRRFYRKLSHNSSCELFKHFKNNVYVSSLKLNSEENTLPESQTKSNQQPFSVSTCALRYVKMDSPTDICRNKIQIKYKTNDNTGLITIVESLHNPIDHVLLGKLICHLLGIESLNENQSPK
ncbi:hypothetical protein O3M35_012386 [Rhynocoris fuscipes]|uniref:Uncharacterized protein n=1 Tax=Rhynocoris fuscipes TaxID=488301 RepID=A0AAW1CUQ2_9HEMI